MRTWGRNAKGEWVKVETDENGFSDAVWLTTLAQNLKLAPEESPFYATCGIPAMGSVIQQVLPTYHISKIQKQFASYFTSLSITLSQEDPPVYLVSAVTKSGSVVIHEVAT